MVERLIYVVVLESFDPVLDQRFVPLLLSQVMLLSELLIQPLFEKPVEQPVFDSYVSLLPLECFLGHPIGTSLRL
jgi:hypothetical protein